MKVRINLSNIERNDTFDFERLTTILKENKAAVSFFNSNNVEEDFLYEIEDNGFIVKGKSSRLLFETLATRGNKQLIKG